MKQNEIWKCNNTDGMEAFNGGPRTLLTYHPHPWVNLLHCGCGCYFIFCRRRWERVVVVMKWQHTKDSGRTGVAGDEIWFLLRWNPEFIKLRFTYKRCITEIPQSYHLEWVEMDANAQEVVMSSVIPFIVCQLFKWYLPEINSCGKRIHFLISNKFVIWWEGGCKKYDAKRNS